MATRLNYPLEHATGTGEKPRRASARAADPYESQAGGFQAARSGAILRRRSEWERTCVECSQPLGR